MTRSGHFRQYRSRLVTDALVTAAAVGLAFLALDDITTDAAVSFAIERTALFACAVWFGFVAWRLVCERHRIVGGLSFVLLGLAAVVQPAVGPGMNPMRVEYLVTVCALAWFVGLGGILALWGWSGNRYAA